MARGKSVTKLLLDSSQAALFAGIEIHNKPHIDYRYPTAIILIVNAWELALKAYVYKFISKKSIYEKDSEHTISFSKALILVRDHINGAEKNKTEILRQYFINHPQSIDKYTFLQNSAFTHWVKEKCSKMC